MTSSNVTCISTNRNSYPEVFPQFASPGYIGCFSVNEDRKVKSGDKSVLAKLNLPSVGQFSWDLNDGYEDWIQRDDINEKEYIDNILHFLCQKCPPESRDLKEVTQNADIVCWRGLLTKIALTPYENRDDYEIAVVRWQNVCFLCEFDTQKRKDDRIRQENDHQSRKMSFWGYKFEQYCSAKSQSDLNTPVNTNVQFCLVQRSKLDDVRILYSGETDAVDENGEYIELKTQRRIDSDRQLINFYRFKAPKWFLQSFFVGIKTIVAGIRDDSGVVDQLWTMEVKELARIGADKNTFKAAVCMQFLKSFLAYVKTFMERTESANEVYLVKWRPGQTSVSLERTFDKSKLFLPKWFFERFGMSRDFADDCCRDG